MGLQFTKHRHGNGPEHFAAETPGGVLELYPLSSSSAATPSTRIGFRVPSVDVAVAQIRQISPISIHTETQASEWGKRAVITDPDGHRVELTQA